MPRNHFFLVDRKIHMFGVCCEAIACYTWITIMQEINYLIDKAVFAGKEANTVISLLHHSVPA